MIKAGIIGGSGITGREIIRILLGHSGVKLSFITSRGNAGENAEDYFPEFRGRLNGMKFVSPDDRAVFSACDLMFVCLPHTEAMEFVKQANDMGVRVIDMSADYRIKDPDTYKKWYKHEHKYPALLKKAVFGLPEFYRARIKKADILANPGCYATSVILAAAPALENFDISSMIADSKSGVSGAGIKPTNTNIFVNVNENLTPYNYGRSHRHIGEIEEILKLKTGKMPDFVFVPQLLPVDRGILSVLYIKTKKKVSKEAAEKAYREYYKKEPFIRIVKTPDLHSVQRTNFCDIGITVIEEQNLIIAMSSLDNLVKGASGQAVQNMNIMFGFEETEGLL